MILSVHAIFGAAVASLIPTHPVLGFALGFASHFALDAIPHKDYTLLSMEPDPEQKIKITDGIYRKFRLIRDMAVVSLDAFIGLVLAFLFFFNPAQPAIFLLGAVGALLPDFLTFLYLILRHKPFGTFFNFHVNIIHSKVIFKLHDLTGVFIQFCTLAVLLGILFGVKYFI